MPDPSKETREAGADAHLPAAIGLAGAVALLAFLILLGPVHAWVPTVPLPEPLLPHHQNAETLLFGITFLLIGPLVAFLAPRLIDRVLAGGNPGLAGPLAALTVAVAAAVPALVRLAGVEENRLWVLSGFSLLALLLLAPFWLRAMGGHWPAAARLEGKAFPFACAGGLAVLAAITSLGYFSHIDRGWLAVGLIIAGLAGISLGRVKLPRPLGRWGLVIDLAILVLVILAVPDMVVFRGVGETGVPGDSFITYVINFHQSLYLGAASQILNGSVLLVDTVSQYGVASIYLLAAFFEIAPIGNGTLAFFDASLTALSFGAGFAILRFSGVGRLVAALTMLVALVVLVWALEYPAGGLLQHGGLRFGLPVPLIFFWAAAARFPRHRRWLRGAGWAVVGLSSIWALEAFTYVTGALVGMLLLEAALMTRGRRRWLLRQALFALAAWAVAFTLFALATLIWSGSLPDWGMYLTYLRDFLAGDVGDLTYDVPAWSPGLTVGFAYLMLALAVAVTVIRKPGWLGERPVAAIALAGLAGYGILLYSYFDNRSLAHVIPYISLPLVLSIGIWLGLLLRDPAVSHRNASAALVAVLAVVALSFATVMPTAADRSQTSLLAYLLPGGKSVTEGFERLWNPPELEAGAEQGAALLRKFMPGQDASPVITVPDLDNNILSLAGRANSLAITDAKEQSWVEGPHIGPVRAAASELEPGDLMLIDRQALRAYRVLARNPVADRAELTAETTIADIQLIALLEIAGRFRLEPVARQGDLLVVRLLPRTAGPGS